MVKAESKAFCYTFPMIASLKGTITLMSNRYVVLAVNDIGYKVFLSEDCLHGLTIGKEISLWTYLAVRDDALDLYGFIEKKEKDFFELLIGISGIGPKGALNILSAASTETLASAVRSGSVSHLVKVSGIGRKTAEKIVLELKDKLGGLSGEETTAEMSSDMDVIEALKALGYETDEAREALKKIGKEITETGAKVKAALKVLSK